MRTTPFHALHVAAGARMVPFAGWDMPVTYGSQIEEHRRVREDVGMFDVSHMLAVDLVGPQAEPLLEQLLANDPAKLTAPGKALYSCLLNEHAGVIDDLIVYRRGDGDFRLVVNAGTADGDVAWISQHAATLTPSPTVTPRRDLAILAVQGPRAAAVLPLALPALAAATALKPFFGMAIGDWWVARTGYTGEDGFELIFPAEHAVATWQALLAAGVTPIGLGARDTLRLEAGMNLYGQDMDTTTHPLESGLAWTVDLRRPRPFIGRSALEQVSRQQELVGLILAERGVLRSHQRVITRAGEGSITSGTFSPTLQRAIALARVPVGSQAGDAVEVDIRGKLLPAIVVKYPFVRSGKVLVNLPNISGAPA